jgi:hypothetical protein
LSGTDQCDCPAAGWSAKGDKTEQAYRPGDLFERRRRLINDWAMHCLGEDASDAKGKVVALR